MSRGDAALEMDVGYLDPMLIRWERWFEAEGGQAEFGESWHLSTRHKPPPGIPLA
jgi:hypothetical protein